MKLQRDTYNYYWSAKLCNWKGYKSLFVRPSLWLVTLVNHAPWPIIRWALDICDYFYVDNMDLTSFIWPEAYELPKGLLPAHNLLIQLHAVSYLQLSWYECSNESFCKFTWTTEDWSPNQIIHNAKSTKKIQTLTALNLQPGYWLIQRARNF